MTDMTPAQKEIRLRYAVSNDGVQIDIVSKGLSDDPNQIALYLALALERLVQTGEREISSGQETPVV